MAQLEYNLPELLALVSHIRYSPDLGQAVNDVLNADSQIEYDIALENATSIAVAHQEFSSGVIGQFGLPAFLPLIIEGYESGVNELILESAVTKVNQSKNIVMTKVTKRKSSVKEFINQDDYIISVKGILCNRQIGYPMDQVEEFKNFMTQDKNLVIVNDLLNTLDIHEIVITDWSLPETPFINCQPYEFNAVSDVPLQLRIEEWSGSAPKFV